MIQNLNHLFIMKTKNKWDPMKRKKLDRFKWDPKQTNLFVGKGYKNEEFDNYEKECLKKREIKLNENSYFD